MIPAILCVLSAFALEIELRAEVAADLRTVRGTLAADAPVTLVDPLAALPEPPDDRTTFRTFPGAPDVGEVRWAPIGDGRTWRFEARLPVRYGDVGVLPGDGLWGNGGWYPQPVDATGGAAVADWRVEVRAPEGAVAVLNGRVGEGTVAWRGRADRAALAVIPGGRVSELPVNGGVVRLVERNRPERALRRVLPEVVGEVWPLLGPPDLTVVEDLDLLRLARAAPGMVFLSDRAFRVAPAALRPYHARAVRLEVVGAALQTRAAFADGWRRDFGAAAIVDVLPAPSARKLLGWFSWNPIVDALLYDGTLPYFSDIFEEAFPSAPGLFETLNGHVPGRAAAAQLDDLRGHGTGAALTDLVLGGASWEAAVEALNLPAELLAGWDRPYRKEQDYAVVVGPDGARVERRAPADAPEEVVVVRVDGEPLAPWLAGPGPDALPLPERPARVEVDPAAHTAQADRANDRWPNRWTVVVSGGLYNINPSEGTFDLSGDLLLRRRNDSRNVFVAGVEHDAQDIVSLDVGWVRWIGPLLDRRKRAHRLTFFVGPSLLDPAFRPTDRGAVAIGGAVGYAWDTRTDPFFARSGHRVAVGVGGGFVPESDDRWASASATVVRLLSPHPRHVFGLKLKGGWASGDVEHRLLPLGGAGDVRGVPESALVANARVTGSFEYRWAPLRNASIPLPWMWLADLHVSPGIDAGVAWRGEERHAAVGASLGVHALVDLLGAQPYLAGVTVATPFWTEALPPSSPQIYIDFAHAF